MVASTMAESTMKPSAEGQTTAAKLIYFSSASNYTHRFVEKLGFADDLVARLPLITSRPTLLTTEPYVLLFPTYGGGDGRGAVPKQVIKFLNVPENRDLLQGIIASGNTNFHDAYCLGGDIVARKTDKPVMYRFELMGTEQDVTKVKEGLEEFWGKQ
ncbi:class Ib ribonucleoside-diphosphate reductase assembly flavoprotein NrdI [Micrococcoides hystricis]|uniref:Protein NrdI n=1 Tax=Micrococcoides hystricis TaxID=1572761 RepID=A0ABV6P8I7_9MICC